MYPTIAHILKYFYEYFSSSLFSIHCLVTGITGSAVLSLTTLPFRNTIGYLYISSDNQKVKISSMNFWGKRQDKIIATEDWIPLLEMPPKATDAVFLQPKLSDGTKYKLFVKFGNVINPSKMGQVLE